MDMQMRVRRGFLNLAVPPRTLARCSPACLRVELMQNKAGMLSAVWRQTLCDELCTSSATHSTQVPTARGGQVINHTRQQRALKKETALGPGYDVQTAGYLSSSVGADPLMSVSCEGHCTRLKST